MRATLIAAILAASTWVTPAAGQDATARVVPGLPVADRSWRGALTIALPIERPVRWRAFVEADPPRIVVDTAEVDWTSLDAAPLRAAGVVQVASGRVGPGWSRLVLVLEENVVLDRAWLDSAGPAIRLRAVPGQGQTGPLIRQGWERPSPAGDAIPRAPSRRVEGGPLVVALDPGHGGVDPGAERDGATEADLMLRFAGDLAQVLRREGHRVVMTRTGDEFVGLRGRTGIARQQGADLVISLHADAVAGGGAEGATVYTLAPGAPDALSRELTARQDRGDLLLGVEMPEGGDELAQVLIELARTETAPRSDALADALVSAIGAAGLDLHKRPRLSADFTVLKAPDIPAVLVELGFLSAPADLANLRSADWRARMAHAILRGVEAWAEADADAARRLRR